MGDRLRGWVTERVVEWMKVLWSIACKNRVNEVIKVDINRCAGYC